MVAIHLLRTRGLDELNGLVCPRCGAVLRSYWRYGEAEGLEALAPHALRLGLVAEQAVSLAGTTVGFQMLPAELERLTADRLRRRFASIAVRVTMRCSHVVTDERPSKLPSTSAAYAFTPKRKPAGVRCVQLTANNRCRLFGHTGRPAVCIRLHPSEEMCGQSAEEAMSYLAELERLTRP